MQSHDRSAPTSLTPRSKNKTLRYVFALVLLMLIVGGIAWVIQYLPGRETKPHLNGPLPEKKLLVFERNVARWAEAGLPSSKEPGLDQENFPYKDVEIGTRGHYDFLFKNISGAEVEIIFFASTCDCTSVKACLLSADEWTRVNKEQAKKPADPLRYQEEPTWVELPKKQTSDPTKKPALGVKANEGGAVRVEWNANKAPGQQLKVYPLLLFQATGDLNLRGMQELVVPIMMKQPVQFQPARIEVGTLTAAKTVEKKFHVWSSTRSALVFKLEPEPADPLFEFRTEPLTAAEFADLKKDLSVKKIARPLCGYRVILAVHESKEGRQLDQGAFYRKWAFALDGERPDPNAPLFGPEIVGVVKGDIQIGGSDDRGKIRFASFNVKETGATKDVQLATDESLVLEKFEGHPHQPSWINVELTREEKQASKNRITWRLLVTVDRNALGARPFDEPDAVVLRIVGTDRLVRIPLEGHVSR